jgi:hypothetical protein
MYVLTVIALLNNYQFTSLSELQIYNTLEACQANEVAEKEKLVTILREDLQDILVVGSSCIKIVPALEKNPYERGA